MKCGNGSERTQHPFELFGEDWRDWGHDFVAESDKQPEVTVEASIGLGAGRNVQGLPGNATVHPGSGPRASPP